MTTLAGPVRGDDDDDVRTTAERTLELDVHRLFVEEDGDLLGAISQSDVVRAVATGAL